MQFDDADAILVGALRTTQHPISNRDRPTQRLVTVHVDVDICRHHAYVVSSASDLSSCEPYLSPRDLSLSVKQFWCIASVLDPRYKNEEAGRRHAADEPEASKQNSVINVITTTRLSSLTINH